jgi:hypothetical protein
MSVATRADRRIDLRCPVGARNLLGKVVAAGGRAQVNDDNLLELACRDCTRMARRVDSNIAHVVHRFNVLGHLVESVALERE